MMYYIIEEASEACVENCSNLDEAIEDAKQMHGKYLVVDDNNNVLFDTMPGVSFKIWKIAISQDTGKIGIGIKEAERKSNTQEK